ncbi:MAG: hypothetical protein WBN04_18555 [Paracoccaceae bacterium]
MGLMLAAVAVLGFAGPIVAQDRPGDLSEGVLQTIRSAPMRAMQDYRSVLFQMAPDGMLTKDDFDTFLSDRLDKFRVAKLREYLSFDYDRNLILSASELDSPLLAVVPPDFRAKRQATIENHDADGDGNLSATELNAVVAAADTSSLVERWERLAGNNRIGVIGLANDKIVLTAGQDCGAKNFRESSDPIARAVAGGMAPLLGRVPDAVVAASRQGTVNLPSGDAELTTQGSGGVDIVIHNGQRYTLTDEGMELVEDKPAKDDPAADARAALRRFHPGGVTDVDPADVVASGIVERYEVMPQEAGLLQLIEDGLLVPVGDNTYRVVSSIPRFPIGLSGAHQVRFILAEGVDMPAVWPGHSTVIEEATGDCLKRSHCR